MTQEGTGPHRFWGFSPALDVFREAPDSTAAAIDDETPLRALMIAPGDARHVLRSVAAESRRAKERGGKARAAEFFVYEREPEVLARHMLLVSIALDFELPRRERAELLLEVWANALLREKTAAYVASRAAALRRVIVDDEGPLASIIDVSSLKSRDRDALESVLRTWAEDVEFDVVRLRDERLRQLYKQRYDHRRNVLDWDYTMELLPIASIVHKIHFREWRQTGIAFEVRDSSYCAPNRTLASMAAGREKGSSVMRRGFWADVANGPWAACGVSCENGEARLTNKKSDQHHKSSCDIAYHNVLGWLSELETGEGFALKAEDIEPFEYGGSVAGAGGLAKGFLTKGHDGSKRSAPSAAGEPLGPVIEEVLEEEGTAMDNEPELVVVDPVADKEAAARARDVKARVVAAKMAKLPPFKLKLLGGDWVDVQRKPRHQRAFDVLLISTQVAFVMGSERLNKLLRPIATTIVESAKYLVEVRKDNRRAYAAKLGIVAARLGWTVRAATGGTAASVVIDAATMSATAEGNGGQLATIDGVPPTPDGVVHAEMVFEYDEATADALRERVLEREREAAAAAAASGDSAAAAQQIEPGALPELTATGDGSADPESERDRDANARATVDGASVECLRIVDDGGGTAADVAQAPAEAGAVSGAGKPPVPPPLASVAVRATDAAEVGVSGGKLCAISGQPAKYRDPISGLPYADLAAFRELRKRYPDPKQVAKEEAAAAAAAAAQTGDAPADGGDGAGEGGAAPEEVRVPERPIVISNGFTRRINKIA